MTASTSAATYISYSAIFQYGKNCVIQNLHVDGSIVNEGINAAGFIHLVSGSATLRNCRSSVVITGMRNGGCYHGGFVGSVNSGADLTIEGCIFDGKLLTTTATFECSGFVGENRGTVAITDSLYSPLPINSGETEVNANKGCTFVKNLKYNGATGTSTITNSCYTRTLGTAQGKLAHTITAGENVTLALSGEATVYTVSGITAYAGNSGLKYNNQYYAGGSDEVALPLGYTAPDSFTFKGYSVNEGTLTNGMLTMPDENVVVSAAFDFSDGVGARLVGHSVSLEGDIGVNFYMMLSDEIAASNTAYMLFTIPNGSKPYYR